MSFEHPTPEPPSHGIPHYEGEIVDLDRIPNAVPPKLPYSPKGFSDIYSEAKWLRKLSGNTAVAFMLIFLVLLSAGAYADAVELRRLNPAMFAEMMDSLANAPQTAEGQDSVNSAMLKQLAKEAASTPVPGFLERFGLKILSALGSIGFFVFCSAAVSEISFRAYEGRDIEPYEVLDNLTKSHGVKLVQLGGFFLVLLLIVGLLTIMTESSESTGVGWFMLAVFFLQLYFQVRMAFSVQALIGEDLSPKDAMIRSWQLTKGNLWRLIGWGVLFSLMFFAIAIFLYMIPIFLIVSFLVGHLSGGFELVAIIASLVALALMIKHFSLIFFFQMALYRELRLRLDGLDPEHSMDPAAAMG